MALFVGQQRRSGGGRITKRVKNNGADNLGPHPSGEADNQGVRSQRWRSPQTSMAQQQQQQQQVASGHNASVAASNIQRNELSEETDEDVDLAIQSSKKPYSTLLQSLNPPSRQHNGPSNKRRKVKGTTPDLSKVETDGHSHEETQLEVEDDDDLLLGDMEDLADPFSRHLMGSDGQVQVLISALIADRWCIGQEMKSIDWSFSFKSPDVGAGVKSQGSIQPYTNLKSAPLKALLKSPAVGFTNDFDALFGHVAAQMFNYRDILFPLRTIENAELIRRLTCLHFLNHIFKTRDRVIKNNARLSKDDSGSDLEVRDQGFTRPKVLLILPTREACVRYVNTVVSIRRPEQEENKKRFNENFVTSEDTFSDRKPADFRDLFAGNDDDLFKIGVKFTRKTIKYFSKFYNSDLIVASPLGLRMAVAGAGAQNEDYDFLSSIELVIIDQADAILMQNWEHIDFIFERLNLQPKEAHGCDFSRVRNWYLDAHSKYFRQTIVFSGFNFPSANKLYTGQMLNIAGKHKFSKPEIGVIDDLIISPKQTFSRFDFASLATEADDRFKFFCSAVMPSLIKYSKNSAGLGGVLIFLPSYADFVRLRNFFATDSSTEGISFGAVSEYTPPKEVARARSHFVSGRYSVMLYSERLHHFRRYHLKGTKKVILYGLPENSLFYKELVGDCLSSSVMTGKLSLQEASARTLFSKLDLLKLERIVGSKRCVSMLKEKSGDTFDFT